MRLRSVNRVALSSTGSRLVAAWKLVVVPHGKSLFSLGPQAPIGTP